MLPALNTQLHRLSCVMHHHAKHHFSTVKVGNPPLVNYLTFSPLLRGTIQQLDAIAPRFELEKGEVEILTHPADFYATLLEKIRNSKERIFLSSLYIGKGQHELVDLISEELSKKPKLKVDILLDCLRSTRDLPNYSTATLILPLVEKYGKHRVNLRLYHTPHLHGFKELITPPRLNEIYGLQHMKIYGVDDEVILSGANLSNDYFTNRQDRYYVFKNRDLTNYYHRVQNAISSLSYQISPSRSRKEGFFLDWPTSNKASEPSMNLERYQHDASRVLVPILTSKQKAVDLEPLDEKDGELEDIAKNDPVTIVYPISSFTPLLIQDQSTELQGILRVLSLLDNKLSKFTITAGYFNVHSQIRNRLINCQAQGNIITASPESNSFYKSKGISYYLPDAYVYNCQLFLQKLEKHSKQNGSDVKDRLKMYEWQNGIVNTPNGWSYHAKGLWITPPKEDTPCITVIGSSNYTKRSYGLDLETNALVITKDEELRSAMKGEVDNLMKHTSEVQLKDFTEGKRKVSYGVKVATKILTSML